MGRGASRVAILGGVVVMMGLRIVWGGDDQGRSTRTVARPERLEVARIENVYRLSGRLYSGGEPQGEAAFEALRNLGIRTIVTVDGARPDVETARRYGLRYVHVPIGYDGVSREEALKIVQAARTLPGPVFIHCHHGKHRGPTAAALCALAMEGWDRDQAREWMRLAGTAPEYRGLFDSIDRFREPGEVDFGTIGGDLPETVPVPALVEAMVALDECFDRVRAIRASGYRAPTDQPDLELAHEALLLEDHFREVRRLPETIDRGEGFLRLLDESSELVAEFKAVLQAHGASRSRETSSRLDRLFRGIERRCKGCHAAYRD